MLSCSIGSYTFAKIVNLNNNPINTVVFLAPATDYVGFAVLSNESGRAERPHLSVITYV